MVLTKSRCWEKCFQLIFLSIGFDTKTVVVDNQSAIDVKLISNTSQLREIVVTGLGIARDKKSLAYSAQEIKGEKLTAARDANVGNALAGKIAGVQVLGQSGSKFGSPNIRVRGCEFFAGRKPTLCG
ncbi:MAG: TonB-dependent receptor plug domain-containing protein [Arcicella sp.]|nr:TonB-dependent receptor plug domain-containing protein [Arcicella sp.]